MAIPKVKVKVKAKAKSKAKSKSTRMTGNRSLLIVESPTKVKTLKKFLGRDFVVMASVGHLKDLPKSKLGVDVEKNFTPEYITIRGKGKILSELKKEAKKSEIFIWLLIRIEKERQLLIILLMKLPIIQMQKFVELCLMKLPRRQ